MVSDRNRRIQDRAYEIWVEGGRQDGTSDRNWAQAEQEIGHHDHPATTHPAAPADGPGEPTPKAIGKTKTKSADAGDAKPAKSKAPKETSTKASPDKGKKTAKTKPGDAKPRSKK